MLRFQCRHGGGGCEGEDEEEEQWEGAAAHCDGGDAVDSGAGCCARRRWREGEGGEEVCGGG